MTFPKKLEDHGAHSLGQYPGDTAKLQVHYMDDIYVGYRYYDTYKVDPQFAFGHGLSYTSFQYSNLAISPKGKQLDVTVTLKNTGKKAGSEVVQVYVKPDSPAIPRPEKELKGFQKVYLQPGEEKTITISLTEEALAYYNDASNQWVIDGGNYNILVGSSSRDIRQTKSVSVVK